MAAVMRRLQSGPAFRNLAVNEYDVLFTLSRCPSGWLRLNELNDNVLLSQSSLSRLVDRLEKRGLVSRCRDERDGRAVRVHITDAGRASLAQLDEVSSEPLHGILGTLGTERLGELRDSL